MRMLALFAGAVLLGLGGLILNREHQIDVVARTLWGEARGEGDDGMVAVANVIMNRVKSPISWWGATPGTVALKKWQFSVWNDNDPNRVLIENVTDDDPQFARALQIAKMAVEGDLPDLTGGATHYHTPAVNPPWASSPNVKFIKTIGNHRFYREGPMVA